MEWFRVDCGIRNDPKCKALRRRLGGGGAGVAGLGRFLLLMDFIASTGDEPGVGVKRGAPIPMLETAEELDVDQGEAHTFLSVCADVGLIDPIRWAQEGVIVLPAMVERARRYREVRQRDAWNEERRRRRKEAREAEAGGTPADDGVDAANPRRTAADPPSRSKSETEDQDLRTKNTPQPPKGGGLPLEGSSQVDALVALYNATVGGPVPKVTKVTEKRARVYRQALAVVPNLKEWERVFHYMLGQRWAMGLTPDRVFVWDLDYMTRNRGEKTVAALERLAAKAAAPAPGAVAGGRDAATGRTGVAPGAYAGLEKED